MGTASRVASSVIGLLLEREGGVAAPGPRRHRGCRPGCRRHHDADPTWRIRVKPGCRGCCGAVPIPGRATPRCGELGLAPVGKCLKWGPGCPTWCRKACRGWVLSMETTRIVNAVVFGGLAVGSLVLWSRRRDGATAWLAGALSCLGLGTLVGLALPAESAAPLTGGQLWVGKLGVLLPTILYPYCLLRFAASFDRRRALSQAAGVVTGIVAGAMLLFPYFPTVGDQPWWLSAWLAAFVVQWVGLSLVAALRLLQAGRFEPAVTRRRMQMLGVAATSLSAAILLSLVMQANQLGPVRVVSTALVLGAGGCAFLGLAPPAWLRMLWRRTEHRQIYDLQLALISAETHEEVAEAVLPVLTSLLGGGAAA